MHYHRINHFTAFLQDGGEMIEDFEEMLLNHSQLERLQYICLW
jgi:hypothetical protein